MEELELSVEQQLAELEAKQAELKKQLDEANQKKVEATITSLSERAKQREIEAEQERRVLAEIARRKRARALEEEAEQAERDRKAAAERKEREAQLLEEKTL